MFREKKKTKKSLFDPQRAAYISVTVFPLRGPIYVLDSTVKPLQKASQHVETCPKKRQLKCGHACAYGPYGHMHIQRHKQLHCQHGHTCYMVAPHGRAPPVKKTERTVYLASASIFFSA